LISRAEYLMGRDEKWPLTPELAANLTAFLEAINKLRAAYGKPMIVTSGYRPPEINSAIGGAKNSKHMKCLAIDIADSDGALDRWLVENKELLVTLDLFVEHPSCTDGWAHIQLGPSPTGQRFFMVRRKIR
jgi:Peptidase M15